MEGHEGDTPSEQCRTVEEEEEEDEGSHTTGIRSERVLAEEETKMDMIVDCMSWRSRMC